MNEYMAAKYSIVSSKYNSVYYYAIIMERQGMWKSLKSDFVRSSQEIPNI